MADPLQDLEKLVAVAFIACLLVMDIREDALDGQGIDIEDYSLWGELNDSVAKLPPQVQKMLQMKHKEYKERFSKQNG